MFYGFFISEIYILYALYNTRPTQTLLNENRKRGRERKKMNVHEIKASLGKMYFVGFLFG